MILTIKCFSPFSVFNPIVLLTLYCFNPRARHERTHLRITRKSSFWSPQLVQAADIILAISKLKNTKSTGHDQINLQHIKESLMVTIIYITLIINTSIVTNVFPKPWKHSVIIPIHKSGDIEEPTNFRPINLLPILSKIFQKVISTQLTKYLESNNLLNKSQYAYRNSSTEQALVNVTE